MTNQLNKTISIELGSDQSSPPIALALSDQSCWANLLGEWPLPTDGALDQLDAAIKELSCPPEHVTFTGCPSACLLPILWLRTIWLAPAASISIKWEHVSDPSSQPGRQAAGKLACLLASSAEIAEPGKAQQLWGINPDAPSDSSDTYAESFDLLTNLIDLWGGGARYASPAAGWAEATRKAIVTCASLGLNRIAIYGAGTHTRAIGDVLMEPNAEIVGIIDDDARRHGDKMWGFPIISQDTALELNPDAIILSANSIEDQLWDRTARFRDAGIRVTRLYSAQNPD
jgi:hypothetical protein